MSYRLTQSDRKEVVNKAVEAAFPGKSKDWEKHESDLVKQCYDSVYPKSERRRAKNLGTKWINEKTGFYVITPRGYQMWMAYGKSSCSLDGEAKKFLFAKSDRLVIRDEMIIDAVTAFFEGKKAYKDATEAFKAKLNGLLSNVNTLDKLQKAWPEGKKFYKHLYAAAGYKGGLPAIRFDEINILLKAQSQPTETTETNNA